MNEESVRCLISNTPGQGFYEPLGDKGLVKFFARRECYDEFYQLKGKKAAKRPLINCEDCGEEKPLGCSLLFLGKKIPFCGESCLTNYKNEKGLQKSSKCDFCQLDFVSNFVKTSSFQFAVQVFCSSRCQYFYRIDQGSKPLYCAWCKALKPECSMICKVQR